MIGLDGLQLFGETSPITAEGKDFYAPLIKSFGSFYEPSQIAPEGNYENFTYLDINLNINSSTSTIKYSAVYIKGIINPIDETSNFTNISFTQYAIRNSLAGGTIPEIENNSEEVFPLYNGSIDPNIFGIEYPIFGPLTATLSGNDIFFSIPLRWVENIYPNPLFKISGIYYLI